MVYILWYFMIGVVILTICTAITIKIGTSEELKDLLQEGFGGAISIAIAVFVDAFAWPYFVYQATKETLQKRRKGS